MRKKAIPKVEETKEEWVWVEGFKGTDKNMVCKDMQYKMGEVFVMPESTPIKTCESGYHMCLSINDVFDYYSPGDGRRYFAVRALVRASDVASCAYPANKMYDFDIELRDKYYRSHKRALNNKLAAKAIEFVRELAPDEIFENTNIRDCSPELKADILKYGVVNVRTRSAINELCKLGYSETFAHYLVTNDLYDLGLAYGSQTDLSMDVRVLSIMTAATLQTRAAEVSYAARRAYVGRPVF